jgi:endonuclease YncB( thermonuclease family)
MAVPANAFGPYRAVIDLVHDGDTVHAKLDVGFDLTVYTRIRIDGINAPELSTQAGKDARDFAKALLASGDAVEVEVVSFGWDKYGGRIDGSMKMPDGRDFAQVTLDSAHAKPCTGVGPKPA